MFTSRRPVCCGPFNLLRSAKRVFFLYARVTHKGPVRPGTAFFSFDFLTQI